MKPKLRVWVVFGNRLKFGDGRARLLELIDERGSLRQAAAEFDMSYRNAWGYLRELESAAGFKLVERSPAGTLRSGMRLTPEGRQFVACYRTFQRRLDATASRHFAHAFRGRSFGRRVSLPRKSQSPRERGTSTDAIRGSRHRRPSDQAAGQRGPSGPRAGRRDRSPGPDA